jgi:hypothetical protein
LRTPRLNPIDATNNRHTRWERDVTRRRWLATACTVLFFACSSDGGDNGGPTGNASPAASPTVAATPWPTATSAGTPATADAAELDSSTALPGQYFAPHPGQDGQRGNDDDYVHLAEGATLPICTAEQLAGNNFSSPLCYHSNPPTSGPHASSPMQFGVLENPAPKENLIHNMEHGGVVVWYNTTDQEVIDDLKSIVREQYNDRRRLVVLSSYSGMEPETIALTSWTRLDKFPVSDFESKRVNDFIEEHQRRFNPEGL